MQQNAIFPSIDLNQLEDILKGIDEAFDLLSVTLTTGEILLGGTFKWWREPSMAHAFPWDGKSFSLEFNAPEGRDFDRTCFVTVPLDQIANVSRIPLDNGSRPHRPDEEKQRWERLLAGRPEALASWSSLRVGSYPNPWATLIYEHNIKIAKALGYEIGAIFERAFSPDGIPPEGIRFTSNYLLYADWDFFGQHSGGNPNIGVSIIPGLLTVGKQGFVPMETQVFNLLKSREIPRTISSSSAQYVFLKGVLFVPEPAQTDVYGTDEICLYKIMESEERHVIVPVIVKMKWFRFVPGYLSRISSPLVFFGEEASIPTSFLGEHFSTALIAQAIGYIADN